VQRRLLPFLALAPQEGLEPLDELFHRAWSLDPARRPLSASAFAMELAEALAAVPGTLLTSRRTLRDGVLRAGTIPPVAGAGGRPGTMRFPTPLPGAARVSTRPPPMSARGPSGRPISPLLGSSSHSAPRIGTAPGHAGLPQRASAGGEIVGAYRRSDEDANSWLSFDVADRAARGLAPSPETEDPDVSESFDAGDAEITTGVVDIDDPEVLELLAEDFTSPAIPALIPKVLGRQREPQFEGDFPEGPPRRPSSRPPPPMPAPAPRSRLPSPIRSMTQPGGYPVALQRVSPAPGRVERPAEFDRPPTSPFAPAEARARDDAASPLPWHSREIKLTPWIIALVLTLNLVLTAALVVVLRHFLS
jgi:hypothetical protein